MPIIDDKGRLFGWMNVIDFLVILFFVALIPGIWAAHNLMTKEPAPIEETEPEPEPELDYYILALRCPVCGELIEIKIDFGEKPKRYYKVPCPHCKNKVKVWSR